MRYMQHHTGLKHILILTLSSQSLGQTTVEELRPYEVYAASYRLETYPYSHSIFTIFGPNYCRGIKAI